MLLMAGLLMLLSVMIPHHHHADGSACVDKKDGRIVVCHNFEELMFFGYKSKEKDRDTLYISAYFIADASKDKGKSLSTPRIS